ncbi:olfactory receptor 2L2-like [Ornithorhynchus anatinus]|uniref:olfactory receptor 2L2-like n=1 Tax=Ornithorhynchus anatinus TaxID=9258 RepID=UPI000223ED8D|nr:olfactory receptor 2L2-like [Ornithorhynchus anatinus]
MERGNETSMDEFILLGLFPEFRHRTFLISVILLIYIVALAGNTVLILLIWVDLGLHTPMYFLLSQLSLMDLAYISTTVPKMTADFFSGKRNISLIGCGAQIFFFFTLGGTECLLLTLMSYDRYVAVCHPLRYPVLMNHGVCLQMAAGTWLGCVVNSLAHTIYTMIVPSCGPREIHHFFCEISAVLKLSCGNTSAYELAVFAMGVVFLLVPFVLILVSYALVFLSVLRMDSREGRKKALATCSSHLTVVALYFAPNIFIYMTPGNAHSPEQDQAVSVFCTILTPLLNPLIYSLRNKEVLGALRRVLTRGLFFQRNGKTKGLDVLNSCEWLR